MPGVPPSDARPGGTAETGLDTLATALFVQTDDLLKSSPQLAPWRPARRSDLAGWAQYGYCASHSRYIWGLRLHQVCTLGALPIAFALTGAKADERETLPDIFATEPELASPRPRQTLIGDKNYFGREFEAQLADMRTELPRPARKGEADRARSQLFKPFRQVIESINETFKGQLDLERHHGRTPGGVIVRVPQRLLALTAAIWHNQHTAH